MTYDGHESQDRMCDVCYSERVFSATIFDC